MSTKILSSKTDFRTDNKIKNTLKQHIRMIFEGLCHKSKFLNNKKIKLLKYFTVLFLLYFVAKLKLFLVIFYICIFFRQTNTLQPCNLIAFKNLWLKNVHNFTIFKSVPADFPKSVQQKPADSIWACLTDISCREQQLRVSTPLRTAGSTYVTVTYTAHTCAHAQMFSHIKKTCQCRSTTHIMLYWHKHTDPGRWVTHH